MIAVRVEIDDTALRAILDALQPPAIDRVAAESLNDTVVDGEAKAVEILAPMMSLPASMVEEAFTVRRASPTDLDAQIVCSGKAIKMIVFKPTWTREGGVVMRMAGKDEQYRHAFVRTVKHGHVGVFERKGHGRLPIRELYGPSVHGMLARSDVLPVVVETIQRDLPAALATELTRSAKQAG